MTRDNNEDRPSMVPSTMRVVFGIIMIIVYVGMGVLLLINYFQWKVTSSHSLDIALLN